MTRLKEGAALVTGCSSGVGQAAARHLHQAGFAVYATARKAEDLADLADAGLQTAQLDVSDETSMAEVVERIRQEHGHVSVLVNNAGHQLVSALEECPLTEVRRQFEVNVFGAVRLTQLVLPGMREQRSGRIINVSSIYGRISVPGKTFYAASKHAIGGLSDGLRLELADFGIQVVLVEPTAIRSRFADNATTIATDNAPYSKLQQGLAQWNEDTFGQPPRNLGGKLAVSTDDVAQVITKAATAPRPRAKYPVGILAHGLFFLRRWLPRSTFDAFLSKQFPTP